MEDVKKIQEKIKKLKKVPAFLPENLEKLINNRKKIPFRDKNLATDRLIDIISLMFKKYNIIEKNEISLSSEILKKFHGAYYNYYIDYLLLYKIIVLEKDYFNGIDGRCRIFSLHDNTVECNRVRYYITYESLLKRYRTLYSRKQLLDNNYGYISLKVQDHVVKQLNRVDLDYVKAKDYLDSINYRITRQQYDKNLISIDNLENNLVYFTFDNYGRMHTNFTTLKSEIRDNFLLIDGDKTKTMDINNSQPLFLTCLLSNNLISVDMAEYNLFKNLVIKGGLYEYIFTNRKISSIKGDPFDSISKIKKMVYVVLFGKNNINRHNHFTNDQNNLFKYLFPTIFKFNKTYKGATHKKLAVELQRSESNFLYNNICEELIELYPNLPMFTVHDSITVRDQDYSKVVKVFMKHIKKMHKKI